MKEILFRGKDEDGTNLFFYGYYTKYYNKDSGKEEDVIITRDSSFKKALGIIPSTVGQYSTIDDKNGHKIFEDDIVKRESMAPGGIDFIGTVVFREGTYQLDNGKDCIPLFTEIDTIEIIGSIHENKDLTSTQCNL